MILTKGKNFSVVIAAAGRGSRSGLSYPKTLFPIQGKPILVHLFATLKFYDPSPIIIVSPEGLAPITSCLAENELSAELVIQESPKGMGDAVLQIQKSKKIAQLDDVILVWGDIPFLQKTTVDNLITNHLSNNNHFSIATILVEKAYTRVLRDAQNNVLCIEETRQSNHDLLSAGERDIGLFIFNQKVILELLKKDCPNKYSKYTQEHGFLYLVELALSNGYKVGAYPCAHHLDLISLNRKEDVKDFI